MREGLHAARPSQIRREGCATADKTSRATAVSSSKILDEDRGNGDRCSERQSRRVAPVEAPEQQVLVLVVGTGAEPGGILELSLGEPCFPVELAEPAGVLGTGSKTLQIQPELTLAGEGREHPQRALAAEHSEFAPVLVRSVDPALFSLLSGRENSHVFDRCTRRVFPATFDQLRLGLPPRWPHPD